MPLVVHTFSILYNFNLNLNVWSCVMGTVKQRLVGKSVHRALERRWPKWCRAFFLPLQPRSLKTHSAFIPISCVFPAVNVFLLY